MISEAEKKLLKIGFKQTMKVLENKCKKVFVAEDAEDRIKDAVTELAKEQNCEIIYIETMHELGKLCGISRSASCAVIV